MSGSGYPKFRNDRGVPEICIGVKEFECIGVSPPQDHPHIYIDMREADTILCPYCVTRFRFDPRLTPLEADPPEVPPQPQPLRPQLVPSDAHDGGPAARRPHHTPFSV